MIKKKQVANFIDIKRCFIQAKTKVFVTTVEIQEILKDQRVKNNLRDMGEKLFFILAVGRNCSLDTSLKGIHLYKIIEWF